jgi:hypothetical protein
MQRKRGTQPGHHQGIYQGSCPGGSRERSKSPAVKVKDAGPCWWIAVASARAARLTPTHLNCAEVYHAGGAHPSPVPCMLAHKSHIHFSDLHKSCLRQLFCAIHVTLLVTASSYKTLHPVSIFSLSHRYVPSQLCRLSNASPSDTFLLYTAPVTPIFPLSAIRWATVPHLLIHVPTSLSQNGGCKRSALHSGIARYIAHSPLNLELHLNAPSKPAAPIKKQVMLPNLGTHCHQ